MAHNWFNRDLARFGKLFEERGAIRRDSDGFEWIDATKVHPRILSAYNLLMQYGYANGLL